MKLVLPLLSSIQLRLHTSNSRLRSAVHCNLQTSISLIVPYICHGQRCRTSLVFMSKPYVTSAYTNWLEFMSDLNRDILEWWVVCVCGIGGRGRGGGMFCFRIIQQLLHTSLNALLCCFVTVLFPPPPPPPQESNFTVKLCTLDDHHRNNKISTILVRETERSKLRVSFNASLSSRAVQLPLHCQRIII